MPPPDPQPWKKIKDPRARLQTALAELYPYFRRTQPYWANILRDAEVMPLVREFAQLRRLDYLQETRDILAVGWNARGARRTKLLAALGLAVDFRTWETLATKQALDDQQAIALVSRMVSCATR
jgi:hypothetical protein